MCIILRRWLAFIVTTVLLCRKRASQARSGKNWLNVDFRLVSIGAYVYNSTIGLRSALTAESSMALKLSVFLACMLGWSVVVQAHASSENVFVVPRVPG